MQRLADHVANGAYFYFNFEYDSSKKSIEFAIGEDDRRYELGISPRQRSYRLEKGHPICTMIVQRDVLRRINGFYIAYLQHLQVEISILSTVSRSINLPKSRSV
jgi:hypothetical protein